MNFTYLLYGIIVFLIVLILIQYILYKKRIKKNDNSLKILDTSVIIDGRIVDVCKTGFLEGTIIIPKFILHELQHIADSSDPLKRNKGRRGMDVLKNLKRCDFINVEIIDKDYKNIREVDEKIVAIAKELNAKILTNDYNLNKVAELQGVKVLNLNDLSNALKPVFLPGEKIVVKIIKDGKEKDQGVAYLPDGTMIVVDNARRFMNKKIEVTVTNVLQTEAGRMIFARYEGRR